jgi:nucleoside-triphosphatase THEP1
MRISLANILERDVRLIAYTQGKSRHSLLRRFRKQNGFVILCRMRTVRRQAISVK